MRRTLLRFQLRIVSAVAAALLLLVGGSATVQAINHSHAQEQSEVSEKEAHFWRIVAGEASGSTPTVDVLLARDLRGLNAVQVNEFRGNSNRYGGVTDAIGFDPFDETGLDCFECGPLDQDTKNNLGLIRSGQLEDVLATTVVEKPDEGFSLTPFGLGIPTTVIFLWMVGGPLTLAAAHYSARYFSPSTYPARRFSDAWQMDSMVDRSEHRTIYTLVMLAPSFFIPYGAWLITSQKRLGEQVREKFPDHMMFIDDLDRTLDRLPESFEKEQVRSLRNSVMLELESQTRGFGSDRELDSLLSRLTDVQEHLALRTRALKELEGR